LPVWRYDDGVETYTEITSEISPDIYYNKAGFDKNSWCKNTNDKINGHKSGIGYVT
jgi:hypothetical protein